VPPDIFARWHGVCLLSCRSSNWIRRERGLSWRTHDMSDVESSSMGIGDGETPRWGRTRNRGRGCEAGVERGLDCQGVVEKSDWWCRGSSVASRCPSRLGAGVS